MSPPAPDTSAVYRERSHLVAHLAAIYPSCVGVDEREPEWPVIYILLPSGDQVSWHVSSADMDLFAHVKEGQMQWDGHDTEEKYRRLDRYTRAIAGARYAG